MTTVFFISKKFLCVSAIDAARGLTGVRRAELRSVTRCARVRVYVLLSEVADFYRALV